MEHLHEYNRESINVGMAQKVSLQKVTHDRPPDRIQRDSDSEPDRLTETSAV